MKLLIISDSHDNIVNLRTVMEIAKKSGVKAVIHCGDWSSAKSVETILSFGIPLYTVLGNADVEEGIEDYLKFNATKFDPDFLKFKVDGRVVGVTHKYKENDKRTEGCDIVFNGDYHSQESKIINFRKFVRPGAIINGINFAVYETENNEVEFINEPHT